MESKQRDPGGLKNYIEESPLPNSFAYIEWGAEKFIWISTHFATSRLIGIFAAVFVFLTGIIQFQQSIDSSLENKINVAWSVVGQAASAQFGQTLINELSSSSIPVEKQSEFGKIGNIGLTGALETLYKHGVELENLQLRSAYLSGVDLNAKYYTGWSNKWPFIVEKYTRANIADCNLQATNMVLPRSSGLSVKRGLVIVLQFTFLPLVIKPFNVIKYI